MARVKRLTPGGVAYHVMNRRTAGLPLFDEPGDYDAAERVLGEARARFAMRLCACVLTPNHWHLGAEMGTGDGNSRPHFPPFPPRLGWS
jgi:putative transposase